MVPRLILTSFGYFSCGRRSRHRGNKASGFGIRNSLQPRIRVACNTTNNSMDHRDMKRHDLKLMSVDELWALHVEIADVLTRRISAEKTQLELRLQKLRSSTLEPSLRRPERRPYPRVVPKYRNPAKPGETWAGRGKQPRWLTAQLRSGKKLDDFRIQPSSGRGQRLNSRRDARGAQNRS